MDLQAILMVLYQSKLCLGISDPGFAPVTSKCKGVFKDRLGKCDIPMHVSFTTYIYTSFLFR